MPKNVLDVGNCYFDHSAIRRAVCAHFEAEVTLASTVDAALARLREQPFDLVLVNRELHGGGGDGIELIRQIKADAALGHVAVMLVSDRPESQREAVEVGARPGFGKGDLETSGTWDKLAEVLA